MNLNYSIWNLVFLIVKCGSAMVFPPSPCPETFYYEDVSMGGDRWYGVISKTLEHSVTGFQLRITLTQPSQLLASWEGSVITNDNKVYIIFDPVQQLQSRTTVQFRIMVKFDRNKSMPFLQSIHMNGRRACPPDSPLIIYVGDDTAERPISPTSTTTRPDIYIPQSSDIWPERDVTPSYVTTTTQRAVQISTKQPTYPTKGCGQVDMATPLITHGGVTHRGQWPWHVALYRTEGIDLSYKCGGTLASNNKVITAAHCVTTSQGRSINPSQLVLYLGKYRLEQFADEAGIQIKQVQRVNIHPNYNTDNFYGDIAILTLTTDAEYTNFVRPICLWEATTTISDIENKLGSVVGWGFDESDQPTKDLRVAQLPVVSLETCLRSFPQFYSQFTSNATFCAGFRNGTSPCNGDSGGGLVFNRDSIWYLRGIVSLSVAKEGLNFCDPRFYVIFTDIAKIRDFIDQYI